MWRVQVLDIVISMLVSFTKRSKVKFAQHRGVCETLRDMDGDLRCDVGFAGLGRHMSLLT